MLGNREIDRQTCTRMHRSNYCNPCCVCTLGWCQVIKNTLHFLCICTQYSALKEPLGFAIQKRFSGLCSFEHRTEVRVLTMYTDITSTIQQLSRILCLNSYKPPWLVLVYKELNSNSQTSDEATHRE